MNNIGNYAIGNYGNYANTKNNGVNKNKQNTQENGLLPKDVIDGFNSKNQQTKTNANDIKVANDDSCKFFKALKAAIAAIKYAVSGEGDD